MKVCLTYFKDTGKYYSEGEYKTNQEHLFEIWEEVMEKSKQKVLPGLIKGHSSFYILVDVPEHPHRHFHLILI